MKTIFFISNFIIFYIYFNFQPNISSFEIPKDIKKGDLVLREGIGLQSQLILYATKSNYSHLGIISSENPLKVLHATYQDLGQNGVKEFSFSDFLKGSKKIKIIRLNDINDENIDILLSKLFLYLNNDFDLNASENNLYCTTFIEKELSKIYKLNLDKTFINVPVFYGYYLLPESFLTLNHKVIYEGIDIFK